MLIKKSSLLLLVTLALVGLTTKMTAASSVVDATNDLDDEDDEDDDAVDSSTRFLRAAPEWWPRIKSEFNEPDTRLRRCIKKTLPPVTGKKCAKKAKTCFFGNLQRSGCAISHPAQKCACDGTKKKHGTWTCTDEVCPVVVDVVEAVITDPPPVTTDAPPATDEAPVDPAPAAVRYISPFGRRALDVKMNLLTPDVLDGYENIEDLCEDLNQTVRFYVNTVIEEQARAQRYYGPPMMFDSVAQPQIAFSQVDSSAQESVASPSAEGATDFDTNNQEEGVDEADKVKSDGEYTYAAYGDVIVVWDALTGDLITNYTLPAVDTSAPGNGDGAAGDALPQFLSYYRPKPSIRGFLLAGTKLVVICDGYGSEARIQKDVTSVFTDSFATRVIIFDTSSLASAGDLTIVTTEDIQGSYRDARAIDSNIHVVTTCNINYNPLRSILNRWNTEYDKMNATEYKVAAASMIAPHIDNFVATLKHDILIGGNAPNVPKISLWQTELGPNGEDVADQIYSNGAIQAFAQLASFSVADADVSSSAGLTLSTSGAFAPSSWGYTYAVDGTLVFACQGYNWFSRWGGSAQTTYLLGFSLDGAIAKPQFLGTVPGYILNQYSLSVYQGHLRVASTVTSSWPTWTNPLPVDDNGFTILPRPVFQTNNTVTIFEIPTELTAVNQLTQVASIPNLGKEGERFTSVRFFGNTCYAVTFRRTDPFYVLDLTPTDARVLGELEISGFSSYLHSINDDDTLLVAVGEEADKDGRVLGVQVSLFDATNATNPIQLHRFNVEQETDVWSSSSVRWDFKAFRWLALPGDAVGILIMPLRVTSYNREKLDGNFDGFFAYDVSRNGISERLNVSHVQSENFYGCYYQANLPERSLVFNGNLTTMKGHSVLSTDLNTGEQGWKLDMLKPEKKEQCGYWLL